MNLALILFIGGAVVIGWIFLWSRSQSQAATAIEFDLDQMMNNLPLASNGDALLVSQEHGKLLYINEPARRWLDQNGGIPHLEQIARMVEPSDSFLGLFTHEGQASFQLGKRWVEASSHRIPSGQELRTVVVMRELSASTNNPGALNMNLAMSLINEIGELVNASMGVEQVLQALLMLIGRNVHYDGGEICLWNAQEQVLYQRGWVGDASYVIALSEEGGRYRIDEGITGWVARHRQPVLLNSRNEFSGIKTKLENNPYQSFMAVPLKLGDRFIGTLELTHYQPNSFTQGDLALLQAISKPVAMNIYNAEIYAEQVKRVDDLASLQSVVTQQGKLSDQGAILAALNHRVAELLSADMCGIFLYDSDRGGLVPEIPFYGLPDALIRNIFIPLPHDSPQHDIWERQPYWISNDVSDEPLVEALGLKNIASIAGIINTAWLPLQIGSQRIGVIVVSNKDSDGGFSTSDIQNLSVLAVQAAIVIENLRLYQRERRMDTELVGLQEITNAIGALSHEAEFFGEITERIAHLMGIEMCGILLYDEANKKLVSKLPFFGVSDEAIKEYAISLQPGTIMEQLWDEERYWYSNRVPSDPLVYEADLDVLADQLHIRKTLVATLFAGSRRLGAVQISNKLSGDDFNDNDARLLMIFATQAAAIIENSRLYREVQRSAEQAQGLRRVAELAGNVLTTQETFAPVLAEISRLTNSKVVFVNVLNQQTGSLVTYPRWVYGIELSEPITQNIYSPGFEYSVAVSQKPFLSNNVQSASRVISGYQDISQKFNIHNALVVPLVFGDRTLGELGIGNRQDGVYGEEDLDVMRVIAAQTAAALDRLLLYEQTGQNLNRRLEELDAISRISNELTITLDLDQVLNVIRDEAIKATGANECTIVLLTPQIHWKYPDTPEMARRLGSTKEMPKLADIESESISRGADSVLITDYEFSTMQPSPTTARSAIAAAVMYLDQVVGVLHLYHDQPNQFDDRASAFVMTLAVKASLGYGNSVRYQEQIDRSDRLRRRVEQLNRIFELSHMFQGNSDPISTLEAIAYSVQQSVGFDTVVMTLMNEEEGILRRVAQAGIPLDYFNKTKNDVISRDNLQNLLKEEYRISESYLFPVEKVGEWYVPNINALSTAFEGNRTIEFSGATSWHDGDMFLVTIKGAQGEILGIMSLDRPFDSQRPDRSTIEVLEIFAHQAATSIEGTRLYLESIRSAEQEARLNDVMEAVSSTLDVSEIVRSVAQGTLTLVPITRMTIALIGEQDHGFDLLHVVVNPDNTIDEITREHHLTLEGSALLRAYTEGKDYLYHAGDADIERYSDLKAFYDQGEKVSLVLPMLTGGECLGAVHLGSDVADPLGFTEYRPMLNRMAQIVASAVQNARLFDQAVGLQVLNKSVVESIQQGIVVMDDITKIISINGFMTERYGWDSHQAVGHKLFEYRPELMDILLDDLQIVLNEGIQRERINELTDDNRQSGLISNFYIYPLWFGEIVRGAVMLVEDVTERARLEQAIESRANQLGALTDVSTRITSSLEREEVVQVALDEMGFLIDHDIMSIWRRNGSYMVLEGATGHEIGKRDIRFLFGDFPLPYQVVDTQRVVTIGDEADFPIGIPVHETTASWIGVPLVNQGHVVGMIMLTSHKPNTFDSKSDQNIAFAFASQVAIAIANAELFEQTFDRTNELGILLEAATTTSLSTNLDTVFRTVVELMFSALDMDDCAIMIWDQVDNELEVQVDLNRHGDADRITPKGTRLDLKHYPAKMRALRERDVIVITRNETDPMYSNELSELKQVGDTVRMLVPLVVREESIGLIQLEHSSESIIVTQQKVRLARALGTQVAIAIENARLSEETASHFEESLIINDLSRSISSTLEPQAMIDIVGEQVPGVTHASELYLALYESDTQEITFPLAVKDGVRYDIPPRQLGTDEVSFIIRHRRPLSLGADYFSIDELRKSLSITNEEGDVKSYLGVPLVAGDEVYGVLAVRDTTRTRAFTLNEQRILTTVGSQLGAALQNMRLFRKIQTFAEDLNRQVAERTFELEEERDRIDTLYQITSELARTLDMERLMPRALGMVAKAVSAQDGVIMQLDPITDQLYSRAWLNPKSLQGDHENGDHVVHPAEKLARHLIETDQHVVLVEDLHNEDYWDKDAPGAAQWRGALAVLLETNDELLGVMVVLSRDVNSFVESHLRLMVAAANQVASSINNAELYKLIRDQAERLGSLLRTEQEEAEKNKAILESIADGVILADASGNIILFNTAAERILQVPRDHAIGQSLSNLTGIYGGSAASWAQALEDRLSNFEDDVIGEYIDERLELGERVVSVHLSPVYTGEKFLGTVSVFRDITHEVEADRSKSQFIANVSHELRTPLTPIKGFVDMVLMGAAGEVNETQKSILGTVKQNVDRLALLVEDVLKISQIDSGRERLKISNVDVNEVINGVLNKLKSAAKHQKKTISVHFAPVEGIPTIQADYDKVFQIIHNVIDNAFNYTLNGGSIDITAQPDSNKEYMLIAVQDTGVGIPKEFYDNVWKRFERHEDTVLNLDIAGTGLGLPIVKEMVEMHGGRITFDSTIDVGTTFYINMPIKQPEYLHNLVSIGGN